MATLAEALCAYLKSDAGVKAIVRENVFPVEAAQASAAPRIVYQIVEEHDDYDLQGSTGQPTAKVKISCYGGATGDGYAAAKVLAEAVKNAVGSGSTKLKNFAGNVSLAGLRVQAAWVDNEQDAPEPPADASGTGQQCRELDWTFCYVEA